MRRSLEPLTSRRVVAEPATSQASTAESSDPHPAIAASSPAVAPLLLDSQAIRRAVAGSEGAVRRMAKASGSELDLSHQSPLAKFGSAVAESAIPDCLAPNQNATLLFAPVIAVQALRGKCK